MCVVVVSDRTALWVHWSHTGVKSVAQELRKASQQNKELGMRLTAESRQNQEAVDDHLMTIAYLKNSHRQLESKYEDEVQRNNDTAMQLKLEVKSYRTQANDMVLENQFLHDENKMIKFDLDKCLQEVLDFPRREEQILRDAERILRLRY